MKQMYITHLFNTSVKESYDLETCIEVEINLRSVYKDGRWQKFYAEVYRIPY